MKPISSNIFLCDWRRGNGSGVVGYEEIEEAVVVDVGGDCAPGFAAMVGDAHFLADIGEGAVAVVVEELAGHGIEDAGPECADSL